MNLKEFWGSVKDKGADYDGMYGEQCVDLINAYCDKVFGIKGACYGVSYAYEVFSKLANTKLKAWSKVEYKKGVKAEYGDIIVWRKERNGYAGHIAIVKSCTDTTVTVYEQNYDGKGKSRKPSLADGGVREHTYDYSNVYGFIKVPSNLKSKVGTLATPKPAAPKKIYKTVNSKLGLNAYYTKKCDKVATVIPNGTKVELVESNVGTLKKSGKTYKIDKVLYKNVVYCVASTYLK